MSKPLSTSSTSNRPPLNYKLKDNPFFANRNDAKPPLGKINKTAVTRTETSNDNNGLASRLPKPATVSEAKKHVRSSIQKMASSSNVSTNPWKGKGSSTATSSSSSSTTTQPALPSASSPVKRSASIGSNRSRSSSNSAANGQLKLSKSTHTTSSDNSSAAASKADPFDNAALKQRPIMRRASRKKSQEPASFSSTASVSSNSTDVAALESTRPQQQSSSKQSAMTLSAAAKIEPGRYDTAADESTALVKTPSITKKSDARGSKPTAAAFQAPLRPTSSSTDFSRVSFNSFSGSGSITSSNDDVYREEMFDRSPTNSSSSSNVKRLTAFGAPLPWGEYIVQQPQQQEDIVAAAAAAANGCMVSDGLDPLQQLAAAHAQVAAARFCTMSIGDAEELQQRYEQLQVSGEDLRSRIHVETAVQRSIASMLKLAAHSSDWPLVDDMYTSTVHVDTIADELFLALTQAGDCQTRYLQHLAGALAQARDATASSPSPGTAAAAQTKDIARLEYIVSQYTGEHVGDNVPMMLDALEKRLQQQQQQQQPEGDRVVRDLQDAVQRARRDREEQVRHLEKELQQAKVREHELLRKQQGPATALRELQDALEQAKQREDELRAQLKQPSAEVQQLQQELRRAKETERELRAQIDKHQHPAAELQQLQDELRRARETERHLRAQVNAAPAAQQLQQLQDELAEAKQQQQQRGEGDQQQQQQQEQMQQLYERCDRAEKQVQLVQQQLDVSRRHETTLQQQLDERAPLEQQISRALAATSCQSLDDMVHKITDNTPAPAPSSAQAELEAAFKAAQEEYTRREAALMLQTASVEADLGAVLKEYDRVTRNISDFNLERKKYEAQIEALTRDKQQLDKQLADKQVQEDIGRDGQTMTLRKEFRQLMASVKAEHEQALGKEVERRRQMEVELRNIKHDLEMKRWDRVNTGVQTHFVAHPL